MRKPLASSLLILSLFLAASSSAAHDNDFPCKCDEGGLLSVEVIFELQRVSDFLIAFAYFSIPIELFFYVSCSDIPFKWVLFQFIAFIVLCGMTHLLSGLAFGPHGFQLVLALTVFKMLTGLVSLATAITLGTLFPLLLQVKVRELLLRRKTWDLNREVGFIRKQTEAGQHVHMLTQEIRRSLDRHTILYTTLVELSKTLDLQNCVVWMPDADRAEMRLTHELRERCFSNTIPTTDVDVREVKGSDGVKILNNPESALAAASSGGFCEPGSVAAIRMPMLKVSNFKGGTPVVLPTRYAILVLVLPGGQGRTWSNHELKIVEVVADQVAVALSHASVLEESQLMREKLAEQNRALQQAKQDALLASRARNEFQAVICNGLRKPVHSIMGFLSMFREDENLSNEQRLVVDTMVSTSDVLGTIVKDVMDDPMKNSGSRFPLELRPFELHSMVREAACLSKCLCSYDGCDFAVEVDKSLQNCVVGGERRVFQAILHMVGNLLNARKGGGGGGRLVLRVFPVRGSGNIRSISSGGFVYIRFEVSIFSRDLGDDDGNENKLPSSIPFVGQHKYYGGVVEGMSFNAIRKLVQLMQGDIWRTPSPDGVDESMALLMRFEARPATLKPFSPSESFDLAQSNSILQGTKVVLADSDNISRFVTKKLLERLGCTVTSVSTGYSCLSAINPSSPSHQIVVLLDLHLSDMDSFEVALRTRKMKSRSSPLIIAMTTCEDGDVREKCLEMGMNGVIQIPSSAREIADELKRVLMQQPK